MLIEICQLAFSLTSMLFSGEENCPSAAEFVNILPYYTLLTVYRISNLITIIDLLKFKMYYHHEIKL